MPAFSLRVRLTVALLATGVASAAVVGAVARAVVLQRFDQIRLNQSFGFFQNDVIDYVATYGSWEAAQPREGFGAFERRRNAPTGVEVTTVGDDGRPLPPPRGVTPHRTGPPPGAPANAAVAANNNGAPPFTFMLLDPRTEKVLLAPEKYRSAPVPADLRATALPIRFEDAVVALAIPLRDPNLSPYDITYLNAMQQAMLFGLGVAALFALALGLLFGARLSSNVRRVTHAIQKMRAGDLRQRVHVTANDEVGVMAALFNDLSHELAESHDKIQRQTMLLRELSVRDELTGLHNRRYFHEQAEGAFAHAQRYDRPLTVMICDVDRFKQINDRFSHAIGDEVLRRVSRILQTSVRGTDVLARYGGEEFVVLFVETEGPQAVTLCERIRTLIEAHAWHDVHPDLRVTISMGVDDNTACGDIREMLAAADRRLYQAKETGRNRVVA